MGVIDKDGGDRSCPLPNPPPRFAQPIRIARVVVLGKETWLAICGVVAVAAPIERAAPVCWRWRDIDPCAGISVTQLQTPLTVVSNEISQVGDGAVKTSSQGQFGVSDNT